MRKVKCISLWQPYASLIFGQIRPNLFKRWETRSWPTDYRGPLLIHAAQKHFSEREAKRLFIKLGIEEYFHNWWHMPYGAILGKVDLVNVVPTYAISATIPIEQFALGDFTYGRFAWELRNPVLFETPIPFRGRQRLFNVPDELVMRAAR